MSKRGAQDDASSAAKRLKSDAPGPSSTTLTPAAGLSNADLIAQKRAEIAAKMAKFGARPTLGGPSPASQIPPPPSSLPSRPSAATVAAAPLLNISDMARQIQEAKRRAAASLATKAVQENPYLSLQGPGKKKNAPEVAYQGAGLKMTAHPLLLDTTPAAPQSNKDRYKPMQPKFASIKANARLAPSAPPTPPPRIATPSDQTAGANPYATASAAASATGFEGAPKEKVGRGFRFNTKGKYVQLGDQMRQEAQLEALKQRIAASARKAGLDSEFEVLEKNIRREPPPAAEWWDVELLPNKTYDDLDLGFDKLKIRTDDSPIGIYIQHPIPIPAPWDKNAVPLKPLKLTKKEQKKMRKQRRKAEQQDKQDRVRMGLIPPDPPKVRLANLMRVLTSDAVQDPTKVEAKVRREVAMRRVAHDRMNMERKLTDDQKKEKIEMKKIEEEKKGIYGAVYKIKTLSDPSHRFKVRKNAEQMGLTGITIFNPNFSLVIVEGSAKAIKQYNRLMAVRIAWTEAAQARREVEVEANEDGEEGDAEVVIKPTVPEEQGEEKVVSLEDNRCDKIWEGPLRDRSFKSFKARNCPTDTISKEALGTSWIGQWDAAKAYVPEEDL